MIQVMVCYATSEKQVEIPLMVEKNSTVETVITRSHVLTQFPEIDLQKNAVGIFYKRVTLETIVQEGDRVEIYRALITDPKEGRRSRATYKK